MAKKPQTPQTDPNNKSLAQNRRARHDYDIVETYEAGVELFGSEVKSIREGAVQLRESFARVDNGEVWLYGVNIPPYKNATSFGAHETTRKRKLLLHKKQIVELAEATASGGETLVPLALVMRDGKVKCVIGIAKGRKTVDKRHAIAERDSKRDTDRELSRRSKGR